MQDLTCYFGVGAGVKCESDGCSGTGEPDRLQTLCNLENCWLMTFKAADELPKLLELENRIPLKQPVCRETYPLSVRSQRDSAGGIRDKNLGRAVKNAC